MVARQIIEVRALGCSSCADLGDVTPNPINIQDSFKRISDSVRLLKISKYCSGNCWWRSFSHLVNFEGTQRRRSGWVNTICQLFWRIKFTHGTPFRRAVEEGLVDPQRFVQISIRGTAYNLLDTNWGLEQSIRIIRIAQLFDNGIAPVMAEIREIVGDKPTYCSYDIEFVDPTFTPSTETPKIGGSDGFQAQQIIRVLACINVIGTDLVEVSPPLMKAAVPLGRAHLCCSS